MASGRELRTNIIDPLRSFLRTEAGGGVVLLVAMLTALVWANSPWSESYVDFWHIHIGSGHLEHTLQEWVNDALMAIFFFVVGLEIKRELVVGELRDPRKAALPVIAALGGMIGPASFYLILNAGGPGGHGWGIPVATDIAFAVGVLALLGKRVPLGLKIFLLTLAIADDIGGIGIIAIFYSSGISGSWLIVAVASLAAMVVMRRLGVPQPLAYVPIGALAWFATLESGIHPTIAGVAIGLLTPTSEIRGRKVLEDLEHRLHPWTSFVIVPIFALANAGVPFTLDAIGDATSSPVFWGVAGGLVVGKIVGISLFAGLTVALRLGRLPTGVTPRHIVGTAALAGIGFTVALFIAGLGFTDPARLDIGKIGVLAGSLVSAIIGIAILAPGRHERTAVPATPTAASPPPA